MHRASMLVSTILLAACNIAADARKGGAGQVGSGQAIERSFNLHGFDTVSLAGPHDVVVTAGREHSVRAEGDADILDRLKIEVEGRRLAIGMERGNWTFRNGAKAIIYVTMPVVRGAAIAGSGDIRVDRAEGEAFFGSVGGSGDIDVAALRVGEADFSVAGSGNIRASGSAQRAKVSVAGSGDVDTAGVEARAASVSIVGSGNVRARATETAEISIMGSGDVEMSGSAKCSVSKTGSGDVRCGA